ncbi:hypothetical protein [Microbacterium oleivorans]|uniref:hypothetical protein n=1 Tax=Microbacterium oleivorans TaxID=273677 RepID=UPI00203A9614|nr:hypothetical protein [Microbacterium oleivorans]MCM3695927.1 hypothetical protein [Microbacterium oleivorans]
MSESEAADVCKQWHLSEPIGETTVQTGEPMALERYDRPEWYVYIPAENEFGPLYQQCVVGGTAAEPTFLMVSETSTDDFDQVIEDMRSADLEGY